MGVGRRECGRTMYIYGEKRGLGGPQGASGT